MAQAKTGTVISSKMKGTAVVKVETLVKHKLYKKQIRRSKNIKASNKIGANEGDKVKIVQTKPFSKEVNFKILEVLNHA